MSVTALERRHHRLELPCLGVEAQAKLAVGRAVVIERLDPQWPLGSMFWSDRLICPRSVQA